MPDLSALSAEELKAELARREEATKPKPPAPKALADIDWSGVHATIIEGIGRAVADGYMDEDLRAYVFEAVIEAVYGSNFWAWRRAQDW